MPVKTVKKTVASACKMIRTHWTAEEATRRRVAAEEMQQRLVESLGIRVTAPR